MNVLQIVLGILTAVGVILTALSQWYGHYVEMKTLRQNQHDTHHKLDTLSTNVNGRMDDLLHEAKKAAALEAVQPVDEHFE